MKISLLLILPAFLLFGCGDSNRWWVAHDLDVESFDSETMEYIEETTEIALPDGSKGINFKYSPPIDPFYFSKIEIPQNSKNNVLKEIEKLKEKGGNYPEKFADDDCDWWPPKSENILIHKESSMDGFYLEVYLTETDERLNLYIKYFTI